MEMHLFSRNLTKQKLKFNEVCEKFFDNKLNAAEALAYLCEIEPWQESLNAEILSAIKRWGIARSGVGWIVLNTGSPTKSSSEKGK